MAIKFYAPGIKIREIDMSIVPSITSQNVTQLFFINSHWGDNKPVLIEGGQQEFIEKFGFPEIPETDYVKWLSWDAQFKYSVYGKCLVVRQNQNGDKAQFLLDSTPIFSAKYQGEYGNYLKIRINNVLGQDSVASEIQVLEDNNGSEYLLESNNISISFKTKQFSNTQTSSISNDVLTIDLHATDIMPKSIVLNITQDGNSIFLVDDGLGKLYLNDTVYFTVNYDTGILTLTYDYTTGDIEVGDMVFTSHSELKTAIVGSSCVGILSNTFLEAKDLINNSQYIQTNNSIDTEWKNLFLVSDVVYLDSNGLGTDGQVETPVQEYVDDLSNIYKYEFSLLPTVGKLSANDVNILQSLQKKRKDFVILTEIINTDNPNKPPVSYETIQKKINDYISIYPSDILGSYVAVYHPWVYMTTSNGLKVEYPPSFLQLLNVYQRLLTNTPWQAQAGTQRGGVSGDVTFILPDHLQDRLYNARVNPIVKFQGQGNYVWGQKTLYAQNSQLNRLNVRLTAIYAEITIQNKLMAYLFEPLNDTTIQAINRTIDNVLSDLQERGGLYQYEYVVDARPELIDNNQVIQTITLYPTKTLEYIDISFVVKNYAQTL